MEELCTVVQHSGLLYQQRKCQKKKKAYTVLGRREENNESCGDDSEGDGGLGERGAGTPFLQI